MKTSLKFIPVVLATILAITPVVYAGSLTPPGSPLATFYTLDDIFSKLTANTDATEGGHTFTTPGSASATFHTLKQLYNAIPHIYAGDLLASSTYLGVTGSVAVKVGNTTVASSSAQGTSVVLTVPVGYYSGASSVTVSTSSTNFTSANIASGVNLFGIIGSLAAGLAFGDNSAAKVLTTASSPGTYNATNVTVGNVKQGITFGVSSTGTLTPDGGTAAVADLFNGKTANLTADWALDTGTLNLACNTATFDGTANKVADAYDGSGNGSNRWCMKDTGTAAAGDIVSPKVAWVNGVEVTGTIAAKAGNTTAASSSAQGTSLVITVPQGYYSGAASVTVSSSSANLIASNIATGTNLFGVVGTQYPSKLVRTNNVTCADVDDNGIPCSGTHQDGDYLAGQARSYTNNGDSTITDNNTGLMWLRCPIGTSGASCATGTATMEDDIAGITSCENLVFASHSDWRMPNVFELTSIADLGSEQPAMNVTYFPNFTTVGDMVMWTSTSNVDDNSSYSVNFSIFNVGSQPHITDNFVRCVRG